MRTTAREDLERELQDPEFRKLYGVAEAKSELAVAIANARQSLRLTQGEMSKEVGVSQPYIAKLESGEANPTVGAIGSILAILNLRLAMGIAPLLPKPIRPFQGCVWSGAGDATDPALYLRPSLAGDFNWDRFLSVPVPTGTMAGTTSPGSVRIERREVLVGGAAR